MAISKAQQKATAKYCKAHYEIINIRFPKGERAKVKWEIFNLGYDSVNQFCIDAIKEKLEREKGRK